MLNKEIDFNLRSEDEVLLCCARTKINNENKNRIVSLINEDFDWNHLIQMAKRHKLMPLLYYNLNSICPEIVSENVLSDLKNFFSDNIRNNLLLTGELIKILKLLELNEITAIPYKGPILSISIFHNLSLRQFVDLDFYIHKSDALKVKKLLISKGYKPFFNTNIEDSIYIKTQSEYKFSNEKGFLIEFHLNFQGSFFYLPVSPLFLCNDLDTVTLNNSEILTFNNENLLLILCMHSASHDWDFLSRVCDISELIQSREINWNEIIKKAEILRIKKILFINLIIVKELFETEIPDDILTQIEIEQSLESISKEIIIDYFLDVNELNLIKKSLFDLKKREHIFDGIKDVFLSIFTPTSVDFNLVKLPESLFLLYYFLRPFFLFKRFRFNSLEKDTYSHKKLD